VVMPASEIPTFLRNVDRVLVGLVLLASASSAALVGFNEMTWGVVVGGLIGIANFTALKWLGAKVFSGEQHSRTFYASLFMGKLTALMGVIALCLLVLPIEALGFLMGISTLFPAIMITFFWRSLSPARPASHPAPTGSEG
jgi:hypothetical protein